MLAAIQSVSEIIEILHGLNIKALADSWKNVYNIIEKNEKILASKKFYCVREIEILELQIRNFMDMAQVTWFINVNHK